MSSEYFLIKKWNCWSLADLVRQAMRRFDAIKRRSEGLCGTLLMNYGRVELELIVKHEK